MLESLGKAETLISFVTFRFYCYSVFYSGEDYQQFKLVKSKVIAFKIEGNWLGFTLQTRYMARKILFLHTVRIMLYILPLFWSCGLVSQLTNG